MKIQIAKLLFINFTTSSIFFILCLMSACSTLSPKEEKKIKEVKKHHSKIEFQYKKLHQKSTLKYKEVDSFSVFKNKPEIFKSINYDTQFRDLEITTNITFHENSKIFYKDFKGDFDKITYSDVVRAYFLVNQEKMYLDNLVFSIDNISKLQTKLKQTDRPAWYVYNNSFVFQLKNKKFISCFGNAVLENSTNILRFIFLFDITTNIPKLVLANSQESNDIDCFGDWDNDGNLDYFHKTYRMQETKKLYVQSLKNDVWVTDSTKYIFLEGTFQKQIINVDKSKWYFDLK